MSNVLIAGKNFATVADAANWANQLVGRSIPDNKGLIVENILQFQVITEGDSLSALVLVETERKKSMSSMVINMRKDLAKSEEEE